MTKKLGLIEQEIKEIADYRNMYIKREITAKQFNDINVSYKRSEERAKIKLRTLTNGVADEMAKDGYVEGNVLTK